jgi:predicted transcriptional regulator YdeE
MKIEIMDKTLTFDLYGCSGTAIKADYGGTAFKLMDKMWQIVKSNNIKNKGLNIWVYEPDKRVFAGVELESIPNNNLGLEHKTIVLQKYAYFKHIGSYNLIKQVGKIWQMN